MFEDEVSDLHILSYRTVKMNRSERKKRMNMFKKFLRKELGEKRYQGLVKFVNANCGPEVKDSKELYEEIYEYCNCLDSEKIMGMQMRLNEVMFSAFQVGKTYSLAFFIYLC